MKMGRLHVIQFGILSAVYLAYVLQGYVSDMVFLAIAEILFREPWRMRGNWLHESTTKS